MLFPHVATNIQLARKAAALTQERLARRLNVSTRTVVKWENGYVLPNAENLKRLAEELERDSEWFYDNGLERAA